MSYQNIHKVIRQLSEDMTHLYQALEQECQALSDNDLNTLQSIAEKKRSLSQGLDALEDKRKALFRQTGFSPDNTGMQALFDKAPLDVNKAWTSLETLTRRCQRQNNINGMIVDNNLRRVQMTLAILQGQTFETQLYNSTGTTLTVRNSQPLAQA